MGRRAVLVGVHQKAKALARLFLGKAKRVEHAVLQGGVVDADRTAAHFAAVQHHVIGLGAAGALVGFHFVQVLLARHGKGVVLCHIAPLFFGILEQREICHPQEVELILINQPQLFAHSKAHGAQRSAGLFPVCVRSHKQHVALLQARGGRQRGNLLFRKELFKAGRPRLGCPARVGKAFCPVCLGHLYQLVDLFAGKRGRRALHTNGAHRAARGHGVLEHRKLATRYGGRHVHQFQAKARVRFIRAKAPHGLGIRQALEGRWNLQPQHLMEHTLHQAFVQRHDVVFVGKRHLHIHLGKLGLAVCPQVFIAEAAHNLEIAVEAG